MYSILTIEMLRDLYIVNLLGYGFKYYTINFLIELGT